MDGAIAELGVLGLVCVAVVKEAFGIVNRRNGGKGPTMGFCNERTEFLKSEIKHVNDSIKRVEKLLINGKKNND